LLGALDAKVERPELRSFSVNTIDDVHARRSELVVAGAWHIARNDGANVAADPFGGFDDWSMRVREALIWLGEIDPCETVIKVRENDPQRDQLMAVVMLWKENLLLDNDYTVQNAIERAVNVPSFYNAAIGRRARANRRNDQQRKIRTVAEACRS
jgi:hypothetical protein